MEHSVQIDPEKCVLVMGPQMAAEALSLSEGVPAALSYAMLVNIGIQKVLELDKNSGSAHKSRKHALLVNAYELEPAFAAYKVVETLKEKSMYKEWLTELFGSLPSLHAMSSSRQNQEGGGVVEKLSALQEKGVLLVYTHYDTILDVQMGTAPVLLQDEEGVRSWATSHNHGILHVHGIFSKPDSVSYDCVDYRRLVGETPGGQTLKEVFRGRSVIFAGFDGEFYDPFLPKFARTFVSQEHPPPLLLSVAPKVTSLTEAFLNLKVMHLRQLDKLIVPRPPAAYLGTGRDSVENKLTTTLLYSNKASCLDAAERVKITSAVNVHQLTMRHERLHHHLLLYLDREGLKELWKLVFASASLSQPGLHTGLLGVVLDNAVTVWLDGGMALALGGMTAQQEQLSGMPMTSQMDCSQGVRDQQSVHLPPPSHLSPPISLSTNVALIGSTWTPIPTPSISRPLSTASASTSTARIGHTSPLVSSTSRTSLGTVATRGPTLDAHVLQSLGSSHRPHNQVRRVKSEHVMYANQAVARNRNGILLHRESAPEFVQTSEGLVAYPSNQSSYRERSSILIGQSRPSPSSHHHHHHHHHIQPSPLVKGGAHMEVKIECLDMQRPGRSTPPPVTPTSRAIPSSGSGGSINLKGVSGRFTGGSPPSGGIGLGKEFKEEKQKFITEAQSWSKQVDSELAKKLKLTSSESSSVSTSTFLTAGSSLVGGAYALGFLGPHQLAAAAQPSLTSKFSPEEQEKLLKQHFEQIMQQQLLSVAGMPSLPLPVSVASSAKSPVGGGVSHAHHPTLSSMASAMPALGHAHSLQQSAATPQSSSGGVASSKKKSPLGMLQSAPQSAAAPLNMFPYLPTNGGPGLLCNPSLSQFPIAAAAMFNPVYQAALQKLVKGGQMPALPDHALLQGLMDKVPVVLADGRITFVPLGAATQQGNRESSPSKDVEEEDEEDEEEEEEKEEESENTLKSPLATGCKRMRSPGAEMRAMYRGAPPKRRRSSSLPDINQLLHISPHKKFHEEDRDSEGSREKGGAGDSGEKSNGITNVMMPTSLLSNSPRPRQHAPPTMIHIPQDMKMGDPMLGFPTPPQSSPLRGGFALSPMVLPSVQYRHHHSAQHPHQPMTPVTPGQDSLHAADELRELVEAGELSATLPPSPEGSALPPFPAGRGPIQLWQFLLDLLLSPDKQHMIHWTGNGYEFCILLPEDIAKLWGARKNKPRMNYDKLSRGLRYYYNKGIMDKVQGKKLTFKYTCDVHHYIRSRNAQAHGASTPHAPPTGGGEYRSGSSTPVLMQPMSDGVPEGEEVAGDEGGVTVTIGDRCRLYGPTGIVGDEMELAPLPGFHHGLKKPGEVVFNEGERCDIQGLMGMVKGYGGVLGVVEQDNHSSSASRLHNSLCGEAV